MSDKLVDQIRSGSFGFAEDLGMVPLPVSQSEPVSDFFFNEAPRQEVAAVQLLTFFVGEQIYAVPLEVVETVLNYGKVTHYPSTRSDMLGGFQHRNEVLPVMDLHAMLQEEGEPRRRKIILLRLDGRRVGFAVDALRRAQQVPYGQMAPLGEEATPLEKNYFDAIATVDDDAILVISPGALYGRQAAAYGETE